MWHVDNYTKLAAHGYFVRDREGAEYWVIAVRGKFRVRDDGRTRIHEQQQQPNLAPVYADPGNLELQADSDFAPFKPRVDVFLAGSVCGDAEGTTGGRPFGLRIGVLEKRAVARPAQRVRKVSGTWRIIHQEDFEPVSLRWSNALGGVDPFAPADAGQRSHPLNPVGRGWSGYFKEAPDGAEIDLPLIGRLNETHRPDLPMPEPVGFGPIQPGWPQRLAHAGTYDDSWRRSRAPMLPADFSERFYQAAPPDQIYPDELKGGETVTVEGMHPGGAYSFLLPHMLLEASTRLAGVWNQHPFRLISVSIDGTEKTVEMAWNAHLLCTGREHKIDEAKAILRWMAGVKS